MDKIEELLTRGVANIIPNKKGLEKVLKSSKKLNVYLGIDPTATKIHLGHAVALRKLQSLAELGHKVTFLIGDFTALIGDTSDKDKERPALTSKQIQNNFKTYRKQAEKILDFSKISIRHNSEWLGKLDFKKVVELCMQFSANDLNSRELIRKRLNEEERVGLHEFLYPVMQGYDSYFMDTDIQIGGTDQTFNMQAGRALQKNWRDKESFIVATEFLAGTDGRKMSKSWGNAIWLDDEPNDMYAKVMAIKDELIINYYTLATNAPLEKINKIQQRLASKENPISIKKELAKKIVSELHNIKATETAQKYFESVVQEKETPKDISVLEYSGEKKKNVIDLLVELNLTKSRSMAKQLVDQGGVTVNQSPITNHQSQVVVKNGMIVKVGKRRYIKVKL